MIISLDAEKPLANVTLFHDKSLGEIMDTRDIAKYKKKQHAAS